MAGRAAWSKRDGAVLGSENRLRRDRDFRAVYSRGRRYASTCLLLYTKRTGTGASRIGFAVGKKVGKAVVRNRVKRRLRESCRALLGALRPAMDCVFVARPPLRDADAAAVRQVVRSLLERAGCLRPEVTSDASQRNVDKPLEGAQPCDGCA